MSKLNTFTGIDISKASIDVCIKTEDGNKVCAFKVAYDQAGMKQLSQRVLKAGTVWTVMEATGPYYLKLALFLKSQGLIISVVNPLSVKRFAQMQLVRTKTDKADAAMIADYAINQRTRLQPWTPADGYVLRLGQLSAIREGLVKHATAISNQIEAFSAGGQMADEDLYFLNQILEDTRNSIDQTETRMQTLIEAEHPQMLQHLESIPGIGKKTALMLILISGGFKRFKGYRQLIAYIGLAPRAYESGSSIKGRAKVCKMGMSRIRAMLYVCAWSAKRCNEGCRQLYDRLVAAGKSKRLALVAVANKLIKQAFAIATKNTTYQTPPTTL